MANYVTQNIPGIKVPSPLIEQLDRAGKEGGMESGLNIAVSTIEAIRNMCDGVHIMAIGAEEQIPVILERAGLLTVSPTGQSQP